MCKTCQGRGMLLKPNNISEKEVKMVVVTCDCCGGWSADGKDCENCQADAEGKPRPYRWVDDKDYAEALRNYFQENINRASNEANNGEE